MYHKVVGEVCANHKKIYTKEMEARLRGATDKDVCAFLVKEFNLKITPAQLEQEIEDLSKTKLPQSPLQKGVERLLIHFHTTGVPFALATNSNRSAVSMHMEAKPKLFGMFHHMVCASDPEVERGKPHPDIYLAAANKFPDKPKPVKCLVFEDSLVGLEAGIAAGMQVVMTPTFRMPPEYARKATIVVKSLLEFKPEYFGLPPFADPPD